MRNLLKSLVIASLLLVASGTTYAASTKIRAQITAVRIIVVDDQETITQIYENTRQEVVPDVRRHTADGARLSYTPKIAEQYQAYTQELPSLIQTLYAML